ncbi:hypothetical protein [Actinomadura kijaniata]
MVSAAVMVACVALTACARDTTVAVGQARPEARKIGIAWKPRQTVNPAQWPNACDLLSKKELQAILPQAEAIKTKASRSEVDRLDSSGRRVATDKAPHADCDYEVSLPHHIARDMYRWNNIWIRIEAIGDPAVVAKSFAIRKRGWQRDEDGDLKAPGAEACFYYEQGSTWRMPDSVMCHRGPLMFSIAVLRWPATFKSIEGDDIIEPRRTLEKQIYPAVIQSITAKV